MVEVLGLTKQYGDIFAIKDLNFKIKNGEIVGLLGPNGAGKSTTMNILTGFLSASEGTVKIDGIDMFFEPEKAKSHLGYLPEVPPLYTNMTVYEYLDFVYELKKAKKREPNKKEHLSELLFRVHVDDVKDKLIANLSKGYRQRVGLAGALVGYPPLLILDEPTAGLDPGQVAEVRTLIAEVGQGRAVLISSHILSEIEAICSRVLVLQKGELIADGVPSELSGDDHLPSVFIRVSGDGEKVTDVLLRSRNVQDITALKEAEAGASDFLITPVKKQDIRAEVQELLRKAGISVLEIRTEKRSLEREFLALVSDEKKEVKKKNTAKKKKGGKEK